MARAERLRRLNIERLREQYDAGGLSPKQGFLLHNNMQVWFLVSAVPALLTFVASTALLTGLLWSIVALWLAGVLLVITLWYLLAAFAWFHLRGWGVAIRQLESIRRQSLAYPGPVESLKVAKRPRTRKGV